MMPKVILALIDGGPLSDATLEAGLLVAKQFDARLEVLHVRADPATLVPIVGEGMSGAMVEQVMEAITKAVEERAQRARAAFDRIAAKAGATATWRQENGVEPVVLAGAARLSDLTVIGRPDATSDGQLPASLESALFDTGRPVLVVPPNPVLVGNPMWLARGGESGDAYTRWSMLSCCYGQRSPACFAQERDLKRRSWFSAIRSMCYGANPQRELIWAASTDLCSLGFIASFLALWTRWPLSGPRP